MNTFAAIGIGLLIGLPTSVILSHLADRLLWPKRRKAMIGCMNATLLVAAHIRGTAEHLRRRDPQIDERIELALVDLSEQEAEMRRTRTVLQWT